MMHSNPGLSFWRKGAASHALRAAAALFLVFSTFPLSTLAPSGSPLGPSRANAATFTVINTADSGAGSLRQAILDANAAAGADTIAFAIAAGCAAGCTIAVTSSLPNIIGVVTIDGTTQADGPAGQPAITLNGSGAGAGAVGLKIAAAGAGSTIQGLAINGFAGSGVVLEGPSEAVSTVKGNRIGTNAAGTGGVAGLANGSGVQIVNASNNVIGGAVVADRNVISGNTSENVLITAGATGNTVAGNHIGTSADGAAKVEPFGGSTTWGVRITDASTNTIGGATAASRNVIVGSKTGVAITGSGAPGASTNTVRNNYIGTNAAGTAALRSTSGSSAGVHLDGNSQAATANTIQENLISGWGTNGILIIGETADTNTIIGNDIGRDSGGGPLPNLAHGILIASGADNNIIGTTAAGNTIANNTGGGVRIASAASTGNSIRGNSISANSSTGADNGRGLGIDLESNEAPGTDITANDAGDVDAGPNNLQNFPEFSAAGTQIAVTARTTPTATTGTAVTAKGTLDAGTYNVDFYLNAAGCDPSGNGEGAAYIGTTALVAGDFAAGIFTKAFVSAIALGDGSVVTATATDAAGNTSEFSPCETVIIVPAKPAAPTGTAGNKEINTLNWVLPVNGGSTITSTIVTVYTNAGVANGIVCTLVGTGTSMRVFGPSNDVQNATCVGGALPDLANGTPYKFTVKMTNAAGTGPESDLSAAITPIDLPVLTVAATDAIATEAAGNTGKFVITRDAAHTAGALVVNYTVAGSTATAGSDYTALPLTVTIVDGAQNSPDITVTPLEDTLREPSETVILTISPNAAYTLGSPSTATVTITDADVATVTIAATDATATETAGDTGTFTVTRTNDDLTQALTVNYTISAGVGTAATDGSDYTLAGTSAAIGTAGTISIAGGSATKTFTVTPVDDALFEGNETVDVTIAAGGGYTVGAPATATVTITDNDPAPQTGGGGGGGSRSGPTPTPTPTGGASPSPSPSPSASPSPSPAGSVGTAGGNLSVGGGSTVDGGVTLTVPAGAVTTNTGFSIAVTGGAPTGATAPAGSTLLPVTIDVTPSQTTTLGKLATLRINLTPAQMVGITDINNVAIALVTPTGLQIMHTVVIDAAAGIFEVYIDHFSKFALMQMTGKSAVLKAPLDKAMLPGLGTTLTWTNPAGTTWFQIQVAPFNNDGPGIDLVIGDAAQVAAEQYQVMAPNFGGTSPNYVMLPDMTYTWRLRVSTSTATPKDADWGTWETRQFHTASASATTLSRVSPQAQEVVTSKTPTLTWSDSNKASFYYEVQISKSQSFGAGAFLYHELVHGGVSTPPNSYVVPGKFPLEANTTYYWRVRPRAQGDGEQLTWGTTWIFKSQ